MKSAPTRHTKAINPIHSLARFPTEEVVRKYVEDLRWKEHHSCPYCAVQDRQTAWKTRPGSYQCKGCRKVYSVRVGTIFEKSKLGLRKWLYTMRRLQTACTGVSALQLSKEIGVQYKTAWFVLQRLQECCENESIKLAGTVEEDETRADIGAKRRNGKTKAKTMEATNGGFGVCTDEGRGYKKLNGQLYRRNTGKRLTRQHLREQVDTSGINFEELARRVVNHRPPTLDCAIKRCDFVRFLISLPPDSVDLMLTDPPYNISKKTGFACIGPKSVERFAVSMDFGKWDHAQINLNHLAKHAFRALRKGGTVIVFYDIWKLTTLATALTGAGFVQLRLVEWVKTNPVPLNSKRNYLTNSREIAVLAVKGSKPTFNSEYDNGQYHYPIPNNGTRYHPTQKPMPLFKDLVAKHSKPGDLVIDPFVGSGTSAVAALSQGRKFAGCDLDSGYVDIAQERVKNAPYQGKLIS